MHQDAGHPIVPAALVSRCKGNLTESLKVKHSSSSEAAKSFAVGFRTFPKAKDQIQDRSEL